VWIAPPFFEQAILIEDKLTQHFDFTPASFGALAAKIGRTVNFASRERAMSVPSRRTKPNQKYLKFPRRPLDGG
jgi:hypothetical protein